MLLANYLRQCGVDLDLQSVILRIAQGSVELCSRVDNNAAVTVGEENLSGDEQIKLDVLADAIFTGVLQGEKVVYALVSEEKDDQELVNEEGRFTVAFDPLDGSSLVAANFSVGSIFAIYEAKGAIGVTGADLAAGIYCLYGPKTMLVFAIGDKIASFTMHKGEYYLEKNDLRIADTTKYFAPGNLKAVNYNLNYGKLVDYWISHDYKLRYSGGMVPDIHHMLYKGDGVFAYPGMTDQPNGKLRLLYECIPMAQIVEAAGGFSTDGEQSILTKKVESLHQRTTFCVGSKAEVDRYIELQV